MMIAKRAATPPAALPAMTPTPDLLAGFTGSLVIVGELELPGDEAELFCDQ